MELVAPSVAHLPGYIEALQRGFSPDTQRPAAAGETIAAIERDADAYLRSLDDRDPRGESVVLRNGLLAPKLPGFIRWMWDGEFAGYIGLRWQRGTPDLPPYVPGHIGYAVVPWKQGRGYATRALGMMLDLASAQGLPHVDLTTEPDNVVSQRVITANGGVLLDEVAEDPGSGRGRQYRYRVLLVARPDDI